MSLKLKTSLRSLGEGINIDVRERSLIIIYAICTSAKIVLHLAQPKPGKPVGPASAKKADFVKLSFRKGGKDEVRLWNCKSSLYS